MVWIFPLQLKDKHAKFTDLSTTKNSVQELREEFKIIQQVENLPITETEKERLVRTRIGQGKFKDLLLKRECKCALCGVIEARLLIASHIKPWSISSSEERLDVNNGLLLCPNHDALFDKKLISFNVNGEIVISKTLSEITKVFMNINNKMKINLTGKQAKYMAKHYENLVI